MKIESTDQDIRNVLSSGYYRIPRFQRPYSWTRENIQDFWDDIVKNAPESYFIGSMVVFKDGSQRFGVVDGQQRLTTITILLAVIRDRLSELEFSNLAQGIQNLIERKNIDNKPEFVLSTETSYPFFQEHVLKFGKPEMACKEMREEENLRSAFGLFTDLIRGVVQSTRSDTSLKEDHKKKRIQERLIAIRN